MYNAGSNNSALNMADQVEVSARIKRDSRKAGGRVEEANDWFAGIRLVKCTGRSPGSLEQMSLRGESDRPGKR